MIIRKLRLQKGWSQEQLAEVAGLNVRTIQRIERNKNASLESLMSIASVLGVELSDLQENTAMNTKPHITEDEQQAIESVRDIQGFYTHLIAFALIATPMTIVNFTYSYNYWMLWPTVCWSVGLLIHWLSAFEKIRIFTPQWEKRKVEEILGRKL